MDVYPLSPLITAVTFAYLGARLYRRVIPYEVVKVAIDFIAQYRTLERTAKSKRDLKKLKSMEPEYRKARRVIFRSTLVKFVILTSLYITGGMATAIVSPFVESPYYLPLFSAVTGDGRIVIQSFLVYFIIFIYVSIAMREYLL